MGVSGREITAMVLGKLVWLGRDQPVGVEVSIALCAVDGGWLVERGCEGIEGFVCSVFTTAVNCLAKNSVQPGEASAHASQDDA